VDEILQNVLVGSIMDPICNAIVNSDWEINSLVIKNIFFPVALQSLKDLGRLTYRRFLELFRHMVGLLGRVISPSQSLYLQRTTQHRKTRDKHPCLKRDSYPRSQQPIGQDPLLRPHGHCDRHKEHILYSNPS
jgi:hypothetical protein